MEMAMEVRDEMGVQPVGIYVERLSAAAAALEQLLERESSRVLSLTAAAGSREAELERKLIEAEATIASLRASAGSTASARKAVAPTVASLMAKHGLDGEEVDLRSLDAALVSLSVEQRIAVKSGMLRSGLIS